MDGMPLVKVAGSRPVSGTFAQPPNAIEPSHDYENPLATGVRAIDGMLTLGEKGQRMGIFAGSGVGKSTLCWA